MAPKMKFVPYFIHIMHDLLNLTLSGGLNAPPNKLYLAGKSSYQDVGEAPKPLFGHVMVLTFKCETSHIQKYKLCPS